MELSGVRIEKPGDANLIVGQAHFIKSVDDIHEALVGNSPRTCGSGSPSARHRAPASSAGRATTTSSSKPRRAPRSPSAPGIASRAAARWLTAQRAEPAQARAGGLQDLLRVRERARGPRRRDRPGPGHHRRGPTSSERGLFTVRPQSACDGLPMCHASGGGTTLLCPRGMHRLAAAAAQRWRSCVRVRPRARCGVPRMSLRAVRHTVIAWLPWRQSRPIAA